MNISGKRCFSTYVSRGFEHIQPNHMNTNKSSTNNTKNKTKTYLSPLAITKPINTRQKYYQLRPAVQTTMRYHLKTNKP